MPYSMKARKKACRIGLAISVSLTIELVLIAIEAEFYSL